MDTDFVCAPLKKIIAPPNLCIQGEVNPVQLNWLNQNK